MITHIELKPYGHVKYVDHLGNDRSILQAARTSYAGTCKTPEEDKKLMRYLFTNRHTSPFEQASITFHIKMPIFVMRQFVRHRMFRLNELSARYKELPNEFFWPETWRAQHDKNKQSSIECKTITQMWCNEVSHEVYDHCMMAYRMLLKHGVCREQARMVLPTAIYTEIIVNCDIHNLMHFLYLRTDPHAQEEIQDVANAMLQITEQLFPWTFDLWREFKPAMVNRE